MALVTPLPQRHSGKRLKSGYFCRIFDIFSGDCCCNRTAHLNSGGQSRLLPDARVHASLHQYLSTHVIPAQAGIHEGERKNFWIPACAGMTFWNREKFMVMWTRWCGNGGIQFLKQKSKSPQPLVVSPELIALAK